MLFAIFAMDLGLQTSNQGMLNMFTYPHPSVVTASSPSTFASGQRSTIIVRISGATKAQSDPIPLSLALVLDFSGSIDDATAREIKAATSAILSVLRTGFDEACVIAFSDKARESGALTSNYASLNKFVNSQSPGGGTNYVDAVTAANNKLRAAGTPGKVVLFFSDGQPSPDTVKQTREVESLMGPLPSESIIYHTVGLGQFLDEKLLRYMATSTGGNYTHTSSAADLVKIFKDAYLMNSFSVHNMVVHEHVSSGFRIWPGSLAVTDIPDSTNEAEFKKELAKLEANFLRTNKVDLPPIRVLPEKKLFAYSYEVTHDCKDKEQVVDLRPSAAYIEYSNGDPRKSSLAFDTHKLTVEKCGVKLKKVWTEQDRKLTISIIISYKQGVRDVKIVDSIDHRSFYIDHAQPIVPFPRRLNRPGDDDEIEWYFPEIFHGVTEECMFCVVDKMPLNASGEYKLQSNDHYCEWLVDLPAFVINDSKSEYHQFKKDITAKSLSLSLKSFFASAMPHVVFPRSVVAITPATALLASRGFAYSVYFVPTSPTGALHYVKMPAIGSAGPGPASRHEFLTGYFHIKEDEGHFTVWSEQKEMERLEQLKTSPRYKPGS